jgi:hypothetical protein
MKKFREISEAIKDKYDIGEYDQEGDMAKSDLRSIIANSKRVHDMLKDDDNLPEWVQSKITKAEDYMSTVANYLESEMNEETGFEKTFRKDTGETYDQYANRRAKEEDERQEKMKKQKEDYIKQGIIKAESVELDEAINHLQMAKHHQAIAKEHDRISHKAAGNDEDDLSTAHTDQSEVHQDAAKAHLQAHKTGNPKDVASAKKATKQSLQNDTTRIMRSNYTHFYNVTKGRKSSTGEDDHKDYNYSKLRSGADAVKKGLNEEVELDEAIRHEIAGQVGRFIGNKIDPVHGDIMHAHGKEAYRQAAYHIRKTVKDVSQAVSDLHDRLHRHLRTGTLTTEEVEELDEISKDTLKSYADKSIKDAETRRKQGNAYEKLVPSDPDYAKTFYKKSAKRLAGATNAMSRLAKEEVELDEGKYGAFRTGPKRPKYPYVPQGDQDPRTGLPLGFSHPPKKVKEEVEHLEEKNVPTSPEKWARAKAQAKAKFDVYPSAYANGWAAKKYKEMGGGWKSVSEETELDEGYFKNQEIERQETERLAKKDDLPFTPDKPKKKSVVVGKKPEGYSRARQLARQAMQKYINPVKEENEMSKKAKIVKGIMKKDKFEADPVISKTVDDKQS